MNQSIGDLETGLDPVSEEQHLKAIWRDLGVGDDGFLQIGDLARVCRHIGMEEMNEEVRFLSNIRNLTYTPTKHSTLSRRRADIKLTRGQRLVFSGRTIYLSRIIQAYFNLLSMACKIN